MGPGNITKKKNHCPLHSFSYYTLLAILILTLGLSSPAMAQVTLIVTQLPESTPPEDSLYIAASFNNWDPGSDQFRLIPQPDGTYAITVEGHASFEYKITRGTWESVEGDVDGQKSANRKVMASEEPRTERIEILSWEDRARTMVWNIIVEQIPESTPFESPIFVAGTFNQWNEKDRRYRLTRRENGTYAVQIPKTSRDTIGFKFHRGSWKSVESRANGKMVFNRTAVWPSGKTSETLHCTIEAWEDTAGGASLFYSFAILASALQGLILVLSLLAIRNKNQRIVTPLVMLMGVTVVFLLSKLTTYHSGLFNLQPKILLVTDFMYVFYVPAFWFFVTRMAGTAMPTWMPWIFGTAFLVQLTVYAPVIALPRNMFVWGSIDGKFTPLFQWTTAAASLYAIALFSVCVQQVLQKFNSFKNYGYQPSSSYLFTVLVFTGILLAIWTFSHVLFSLDTWFGYPVRIPHEYTIDTLWLLTGLSTYLHSFLVIRKPELFRLKESAEEKQRSHYPKENLEHLKATLASVMKKQRPYLNPKLGSGDLAAQMNVNVHTLSWIINEGYNKNFFDFVNEYRVEEFKRLVAGDNHKHLTFLALSLEVGFSSKTTFNRAFKKSTGKSPREYFGHVRESQLEGIAE